MGHIVNHKQAAGVMQTNGLGIKQRRRYVRTNNSSHDSAIYRNLHRNLIPDRLNMVWVPDFAYIRISDGFCYLAVISNARSQKVVGYVLSKRLDPPLALAALYSASRTGHRHRAAFTTRTADAKADSTGRSNTPD
jgi:putative transposase